MSKKSEEFEKLSIGSPLRLVGALWVSLLVIYLLPSTFLFIVIKLLFGFFVIAIVHAAFQPIWERYRTMGAFVTTEGLYFAGLLWVPESFSFLRYIFVFLVILGIASMRNEIQKINQSNLPESTKQSA